MTPIEKWPVFRRRAQAAAPLLSFLWPLRGDLLPWRHLVDCGAPVITLSSRQLLPSAAVTTQRREI